MAIDNGIAIRIKGKVQGVGFRPFVWQLAKRYRLIGHVYNDTSGVLIRLWHDKNIDQFLQALTDELPTLARIDEIDCNHYHWQCQPETFTIMASQLDVIDTLIVPDAATCHKCLLELEDPKDRRFHYPFTNCTHCGPRFTIINSIPYDRANTSMHGFKLCEKCQKEYNDPADRRFHAQPTACPICGPKIWCANAEGVSLAQEEAALDLVINFLRQGKIVAIKNLGGFHLVCDAQRASAVNLLRKRKNRPHQPFAVMIPNIDWLEVCADPSANFTAIKHALTSIAAPIVLLQAKQDIPIDQAVFPDLNDIGLMLAANPLQHLLAKKYARPLVMTSANANDQPPVLDNQKALTELAGLADYWLLHDRTIVQRADDSVIRHHPQGIEIIRRSRGYVPDTLALPSVFKNTPPILALGADLKNTFCLINKQKALVSQHLGDLTSINAIKQWQEAVAKWLDLYQPSLSYIVADAHPSYVSHQYANQLGQQLNIPVITTLHHHAHLVSCLAEHNYPLDDPQVIGLVLDGLGYGKNGELWGGECVLFDYRQCHKLGGLPATPMPGGDLAAHQPWRNLLAHCLNFAPQKIPQLSSITSIDRNTLSLVMRGIKRQINSPLASSAGRLFDAVACALGIAPEKVSWEGEAASKLEAIASNYTGEIIPALTMPVDESMTLDLAYFWQQWFNCNNSITAKAYTFHHALARGMADLAKIASQRYKSRIIVVSGGVLQNKLLRKLLLQYLADYTVYLPNNLPCNDGGISFGQAIIAAATLNVGPITSRLDTDEIS
ncbi:carbamoyltransferase HypF [Orbus sturtevantii]|uniref:carbamoyltransferase HypF n=1 Tax=Orbus sturtevantii TaxID=3074109 RepID=UPI00370D3AF1